ncbi:ornithine cyclodeaminase [Pandoraea communis]|uniref:Ornithine cyclodeaminase n=2 Tax=Burkholderiaceae TaxID=119060 RepID=A0A5E4WUN6_9BURK|nr:ornithine cyclodeaminase [Pandoraea communis]
MDGVTPYTDKAQPRPMSATETLAVCDQAQTARLLDYPTLLDAVRDAMIEYTAGKIASPERLVVPMQQGVMLSMPAVADDLVAHKLITVVPANTGRGLPTINGQVTVLDAVTGRTLALLDGPEVTGRRTAAVTMLGIRTCLPHAPREILMYGTGTQARHHVRAIAAIFPDARLLVRGTSLAIAEAFCNEMRETFPNAVPADPLRIPETVDAVITVTTSLEPVYDEVGRPGRVVVGVGAFKPEMAEIGKATLDASTIYVDDPVGVSVEAGDLMRAGVDWNTVIPLATAFGQTPDFSRPIVVKSVGTAAWDLAASRVAVANLMRAAG